MDAQMRRRRHAPVVRLDQGAPEVQSQLGEARRAGDGDGRGTLRESLLHPPRATGAAARQSASTYAEDPAGCSFAEGGLARHDQTLDGSSTTWTPGPDRAPSPVSSELALLMHDDLVGRAGLTPQKWRQAEEESSFVIGADDRTDRLPHARCLVEPATPGAPARALASGFWRRIRRGGDHVGRNVRRATE